MGTQRPATSTFGSGVRQVLKRSSCMPARLLCHSFGKHFHEDFTIGINDAGAGAFWCRGATHLAEPKTLNLLAPGEVHTGAAAAPEGWTYHNI